MRRWDWLYGGVLTLLGGCGALLFFGPRNLFVGLLTVMVMACAVIGFVVLVLLDPGGYRW